MATEESAKSPTSLVDPEKVDMEKSTHTAADDDVEATQSIPKIPTATDWYPNAAQDPANPHNWPMRNKIYQTAVPAIIAFLCPFGSSVYTPAIADVVRDFSVTREVALLPFVFYLLGLSFGPVLAAPLSETLGRRVIYLGAMPLFAVFTIGAGFSNNITSLVICRFFAGASSSPGLSVGSGSMADVWPPHQRSAPMAVFTSSVQLGPVFGPLIGGFVTEKRGWRWTQWVMLFGVALALAFSCSMRETFKLTILKSRAKRLSIQGPSEPERSRAEFVKYFARTTIVRPIHMLLTEPIVLLLDIYTAFTFGLLNAFFAAFPWVFQNTYHFNLGSTGLTYLGQAVGSVAGFLIILYYSQYRWADQTRRLREVDPEARLPPERKLIIAKLGAPLLPISLFWFGWTARPSVHWISPVIAEAFFSCGNLLIFVSALLFLQDCYGSQYGASAAASNTFARYLTSFAFPLFVVQMFEALGTGWACSLLGFVSILLMPIPFAFDRYGEAIRAKSKYVPDQ